MNKIYKVVWSKVKHCYVVTSELAKRQTKGCGARSLRMAAVTTGVTAALLCNGGGLPFCSPSVAEAANVFEYENTSPITLEASSGNTYLASMNEKDYVFGNFKFTVKNGPIVTPNIYVISPKAETRKVDSKTIYVRTGIIESEYNNNYPASNCSVTMTGGTLCELYGAYGGTKNAENNKVTVSGSTVVTVYGGYSLAGAANGNAVEISGATVISSLAGGYGRTGGADGNTLTVNNSTVCIVDGGSSTDGSATNNTVKIGSGTNFSGDEYYRRISGGFSNTGAVSGNTVEISGGEISCPSVGVIGGWSNENAALGNTVTISGGTVSGNVYGGWTTNGTAGGANADDGNKVIINGGTINDDVYGGYSSNKNATGNTVTISGGTVSQDVYGGYSAGGNANGNTVTITGGTVGTESGWVGIRGGSSSSGTANNNTVTISGGTINNDIWGGMGATADGNTVTISGENTVFLSTKGIHGAAAMTGDATNNTVNILTPVSVAYLYGGLNEAGGTTKSTGNTLNIAAKNVVAKDLNAFQNMNFFLPSDIANGNTMLTVNGSQKTDVKGVTFGVAALSGVKLEKGNTVNLLVNANGLTTDDTLKTTDSASLGSAAFLAPNSLATDTKYELSISKKDANTIIATVDNVTNTDPTPDPEPTPSPDPTPTPDPDPKPTPTPDYSNNERLKSLVETRAGVVTMINAAADMLAGQGMSNAAEAAADTRAGGGFEAFGAVSGGKLRAESGSHVDTKGIGLNLGFARELSNKQGKLLFGPVIEYGHGSYDSYQDNGIKADGKTSYWGLGLIAKQTNHSGFYYEGSLRVGKTKSDYSSDLSPVNHANYDSKATYWAAHLGIGKMMDVGKDNTLDVYGKYFYSHTGSDNVTVHATSGDEEINFDAVNSHRLRIGTRLTHALNEKNKIYGGLAWQYEFKGDARATYNGGSTPSPSVKGSSGMIELGWQVKPGKSPMTIDLGVTGWVGKQRGITANLQANWTF